MKIRTGFVSNSSSSSFVCDVSGETSVDSHGIWDGPVMANCCNGHSFLTQYIKTKIPRTLTPAAKWKMIDCCAEGSPIFHTALDEEGQELYRKICNYADRKKRTDAKIEEVYKHFNPKEFIKYISKEMDNCEGSLYDLPDFMCPICSFNDVPDGEVLKYLLGKRTKKSVVTELRKKFGTYESFQKSITKKRSK